MGNKRSDILAVFTALPLACTMLTVFTGSLMTAAAALVLIFVLAGVLPFCSRRQNLWILLMAAPASVPLNFILLMKYQIWTVFLPEIGPYGLSYILYMPGLMLIMSGIELLLTGMAGRLLWPDQIRLFMPEAEGGKEGELHE